MDQDKGSTYQAKVTTLTSGGTQSGWARTHKKREEHHENCLNLGLTVVTIGIVKSLFNHELNLWSSEVDFYILKAIEFKISYYCVGNEAEQQDSEREQINLTFTGLVFKCHEQPASGENSHADCVS
jgi:hypothetical protein